MTWTLAGTTSNTSTSYPANWREVFRTYLNTRTGWSCTEAADNTGRTLMTYTFTDVRTNAPHTFYMYHNNQYIRRCSTFNSTPGDTTTDTYAQATIYQSSPTSGQVWRIWYSSENPRAMLVTFGKRNLMWFDGFSEAYVMPGELPRSSWLADGSQEDTSAFWTPSFPGTPIYHGAPHTSGTGTQLYATSGWQHNGYNGTLGPAMYDNTPIYSTSASSQHLDEYSVWLYSVNNADVRFHSPDADSTANSHGYSSGNNNGAVILSNNRYWLRRNSDLAQNSWIFDFGDTEPDFSQTA